MELPQDCFNLLGKRLSCFSVYGAEGALSDFSFHFEMNFAERKFLSFTHIYISAHLMQLLHF